jgi:hypothetical protein
MLALALLLGCGPAPTEVTPPANGSSGPATSTVGTAPTSSSSGAEDTTDGSADGSGGASGHGTAASSDDTTQGLQPGTSTGGASSTGVVDPSTSTGSGPTCNELYGMAPDYELCLETPDECHFATVTGGGNCSTLCGTYGGTCIDAFDNSDGCTVIRPDTDTCRTNRQTEICVCSR